MWVAMKEHELLWLSIGTRFTAHSDIKVYLCIHANTSDSHFNSDDRKIEFQGELCETFHRRLLKRNEQGI